ncbi:myosin-binding protein 6 [Carex littledalei]|uniref:Myosin-binding protein 6 n=1 Tax=Carex littledalei TaxID=544730 RepID=A0A833RFQ8_9POAL|nr:myosin-binding protein 6 [Carex littledalei]
MLRSNRFLPQMSLIQNLSFGFKEITLSLLCAFILPYNLCVISCLLILGFSVRHLSLRCDQFRRNFFLIWEKLTQIGNGLCSNGGLCAFCGSKMQSLKVKFERDREVMELRKKLRRERKERKEAMKELEREREASAWASEEAMAKISRLQSEKALVEREARQYREIMEKKQLYDKEVIDYLQLLVQSIEPDASRFVRHGDDEILSV